MITEETFAEENVYSEDQHFLWLAYESACGKGFIWSYRFFKNKTERQPYAEALLGLFEIIERDAYRQIYEQLNILDIKMPRHKKTGPFNQRAHDEWMEKGKAFLAKKKELQSKPLPNPNICTSVLLETTTPYFDRSKIVRVIRVPAIHTYMDLVAWRDSTLPLKDAPLDWEPPNEDKLLAKKIADEWIP